MSAPLLVGEVFTRAALAAPDRLAVALGDDALTFGELQGRALAVAAALADRGVGRGSRLATWAPTSLEVVVLHAATAHLGAAFVPLDPAAPPDQTRRALRGVAPHHVVVDADHDAADLLDGPMPIALGDLVAAARPAPDRALPEVQEDDAQTVFLTSGSTGDPKGVVLSHRTQWLRSSGGPLPDPRGTSVSMFPLFHMAGWIVAMQCWQARSPVVLVPRADAASILGAVERHQAQRLYAIPAVWRRLLDADPDGRRGASLRVIDTGTSATPPELLDELARRYPKARRRVFYGSTEAGPVFMLDGDDLDDHPSTVGRPQPGVEVRIDEHGELEVRSVHLFSGYLLADGTLDPARATGGWYRTGDLAEQDQHGVWSIVGRSRQVIRTGGETVSPVEVEAVLAQVPDVEDAAVVGLPDPEWGEIVVAVVVPGPDVDADALRHALDAACERRLAKPCRPRRWVLGTAIPRTTATGQVRRTLLVERLQAGLPVDGVPR